MFGKKHTEATKLKMSENHADFSGENSPLFGRTRENNPLYGRTKENDESRRRASEKTTGELHWNWKGGISCEPYCEIWMDKEYK